MTPVGTSVIHDPEAGACGDCFRAAIASILDLPIRAVPHFFEGLHANTEVPPHVEAAITQWFTERRLYLLEFAFPATLGEILSYMEKRHPGLHYMVTGTTERGVAHTVIAQGGAIAHDPAYLRVPLAGPGPDGCYRVNLIGLHV